MPIDIMDVLDVLSTLCDDADLRVSVKESLKCGLIAGAATTAGALVGGPVGVAVGGSIGVAAATYYSKGKFKPVSQVLNEMSKDQKQILFDRAINIFQGLSIEDAAMLGRLVVDPTVKQELLAVVVDHVSNKMHMQIID